VFPVKYEQGFYIPEHSILLEIIFYIAYVSAFQTTCNDTFYFNADIICKYFNDIAYICSPFDCAAVTRRPVAAVPLR
jgi:hypothetical protein